MEPYKIDELPDGAVVRDERVAYHLRGDLRQYVYPGRRVIDVPGRTWPAPRPEECGNTAWNGVWIDKKVLLCTGCGLDCT